MLDHTPAAVTTFNSAMRYSTASDRFRSDSHLGDRQIIERGHYDVFPASPERWRAIHHLYARHEPQSRMQFGFCPAARV
jgi:hypothetical protein